MKSFQTPNSCHSRKGSAKVSRQPFAVISNCPEYQQCANYLQTKVQGLEMRVKNLNSQHLDKSDNRSTTASKTTVNQSPFNKQCKKYGSNKQIETQSYYESIINKRLENISKLESSPLRTEHSINQASVHSQLSPTKLHHNCILRIQSLTKKLRTFKMVKDQNQDECAPSLAKIKCFCQDYQNDCFDFYRCTDLIALKYFIYLLLQELNVVFDQDTYRNTDNHYQEQIVLLKQQIDSQRFDQMTFKGQLKLQKMVVDTQALIQEIIDALSAKHNQSLLTNQVEVLNSQIKTLRDNVSQQQQFTTSFGQNLANYETNCNETSVVNQSNYKTLNNEDRFHTQISSKSKSPYQRQRHKNLNIEMDSQTNMRLLEEQTVVNRQLMEKIFELQSQSKLDSQLNELKDSLKQRDAIIEKLQSNLQNQDSIIYQELNQRILDINHNLDHVIEKNQELVKENEIFRSKIDQLRQIEQQYNEILQQKNQQMTSLNQTKNENSNLKRISEQYEAECQGYQQQILKLQEKCEAQVAKLQDQNDIKFLQQQINELLQQQQEQNKIIVFDQLINQSLVTDEALYFGQMTLNSSDIIQRQQQDSLPTAVIMLQRDLNNKRGVISQKLKTLQQFGNNIRMKQTMATDVDLLENLECDLTSGRQKYTNESIVSQQSQHNELMTMLIIQCHTLEKMIEY